MTGRSRPRSRSPRPKRRATRQRPPSFAPMRNDTRPGEPSAAPRVSYWTLGCRLNQHDTASMRAGLGKAGCAEAAPGDEPDVVVVNTCTVTARADQEARQLIRRLARLHPRARLVVTGCYAQRAPGEVAAIPGVSDVLGTGERDRIAALLVAPRDGSAAAPGAAPAPGAPVAVAVGPARGRRPFGGTAPLAFGRTRALLKVQDGCDAFCSYCVVPYVRGRSRSLPLREAIEQARRLIDAGFRELVVTGADLGSYGRDLGRRGLLAKLVEELLGLGSAHRVRLSSIEPNKLDPGILSLIGREPRLCRHVHLPLQSGSAAVLRAMRRPYGPDHYERLVRDIAGRGTVGIGADVIVGFPGEESREFEETLRLVERLPLAYLHVFRYSARPGTRAAERVAPDPAVSRDRSERLRALGDAKRISFYQSLIGAELPALVERGERGGTIVAMTDVYAPVRLRSRPATTDLVTVRVESLEEGSLTGTTIG